MQRKYAAVLVLSILLGCTPRIGEDLEGLWELEEANVDALIKNPVPTFLQINGQNVFAVSRPTGDMIGFYSIKSDKIRLKSQDNRWFNTSWRVLLFKDNLILRGLELGYRGTKLRFRRIKSVPDFQEFEDSLIGRWNLYKIKKAGEIERPVDTWFNIDNEGSYSISSNGLPVESGGAIINTRHRKIIFEHYSMAWDAWFYGRELRLSNKNLDIQYSLKRPIQASSYNRNHGK